ncbi:MAG: NADH-quinone oxidoreductase subunit C [Bdellovibrionota bacterium]
MSESKGQIATRTFHSSPVANVPQVLGSAVPKSVDDVADALRQKVGASVVVAVEKAHIGTPYVIVSAESVLSVLKFLRDDERFYCTNLQVVSAVDYPPKPEGVESQLKAFDCIEVVYVLQSYVHKHHIMIKAQLNRAAPKVPSVTSLYRAANWYERECYDLLGIHFEGHPNHKRILLPPDWVGHPLRKDYEFPEEYNGMKVPL